MKGKKVDPEFVSNFIRQCVESGADTPTEIVRRAQAQIKEIDEEIKAIEKKKSIRSKLLDVVSTFDKTTKSKLDEAKLLPFFKLEYPQICKDICDLLKHTTKYLPALSWSSFGNDAAKHNFSVKQMIEAKIITRVGDQLIRGERFDEYIKFVLREDK